MPTSDERREVAAKLREYPLESVKAEHKCKDPLQLPADVMYDLMDIAGVGEDFDFLLPSLADLIDPTCSMEYGGQVPDSVKDALGVYFCSECGSPIYNDIEPEYCPYCGARVTKSSHP